MSEFLAEDLLQGENYMIFDEKDIFKTTKSPKELSYVDMSTLHTDGFSMKKGVIQIKPARKNAEDYINSFPKNLYCQPYKYDVLLTTSTIYYSTHKIEIYLVEGATGELVKSENQAMIVEHFGDTHSPNGTTTYHFRFCFILCSFHYKKKTI